MTEGVAYAPSMNYSCRERIRCPLLLVASLLLLGCEASTRHADLILQGGPVYTMDAARSWARAVVIQDGKIVYAGSEAEAGNWIGPDTRVIDLAEKMVLPSFQDAHIHPIPGGIQRTSFLDLMELDSREAYLAAIETYAKENPEKEWIQGGGWTMDVFPQGIPDGRDLDAIVPDRPIYLTSAEGHSAWVNSKALEIAGIDAQTPDPVDGRIDRDPTTGEAIGALQEGAIDLIQPPPPTSEQAEAGLLNAIGYLNSLGITAFQDAQVLGRKDLETYRTLDRKGLLTARVVGALWWERSEGVTQIPQLVALRQEFSEGRLHPRSVKIMQDGVMENHTAVLVSPYRGMGDETGIPMIPPEDLKRYVAELDAEGFQVHFHAIGDGAVRQSLDAVEYAQGVNGLRDARHHISHLELIHPEDLSRFRELSVVANFQPLWAINDDYVTVLTLPFIGEERGQWLYPINSLQKSGATLAFGSDWNVTTPNVFAQIEVATTRMDSEGLTDEPLLPGEAIDLPTALAAFTMGSAYVNGLEKETGSIEVGKSADLVVIDRNVFEIAPEEISETQVLLTLLEGEAVYGDLLSKP